MMTATDVLAAVLDAYKPVDAREAADVARIRAALSGDVWSRVAPMHVTASAFVVHPPTHEVLLRWHTRMHRWMQVGGHFDPGETDPWQVACREAREETGLTDLRALAGLEQPMQIVIVPVPARADEPAHEHADIRYLLATERPGDAQPETVGARLRWLAVAAAIDEVGEENQRVFLRRLQNVLPACNA